MQYENKKTDKKNCSKKL